MADKFIKAVRVRSRRYDPSFGSDLRISIYKTGIFGGNRIVKIEQGTLPTKQEEEYDSMDGEGELSGDDLLIIRFLADRVIELEEPSLRKDRKYYTTAGNYPDIMDPEAFTAATKIDNGWLMESGQRYPYFEIVEDNYTEGYKSKERKFGYDDYYLNNGARLNIKWMKDGSSMGGQQYSDNWGREANDPSGDTDKSVLRFAKSVSFYPPGETQKSFVYTAARKFEFGGKSKEWASDPSYTDAAYTDPKKFGDIFIIGEVLNEWNKMYAKEASEVLVVDKALYDVVGLRIKYIDPTVVPDGPVTEVKDDTKPEEVSGVKKEVTKLPLRISISGQEIKINAKTDLPDFYVFVGPEVTEGDELSDYDQLDPEYTEGLAVIEEDNVPEFPPEYLKMPDEPDEFKDWKPPGVATSSEDADLINSASSGTGVGDIKVPIIAKSMAKISDASEKETKNYHRLTLIREKTGPKGTQGTMYFNGKAIAKTLERPYISAKVKPHTGTKENENNRCIESGTYPISLDTTTKSWLAQHYVKFPDSSVAREKSPGVLPRINSVPGQSGIRIHAGGNMGDSLGCVLVSNNSTGEGRQVCEMETTKYITKLIYQYKLKEIKIIDEFLKSA